MSRPEIILLGGKPGSGKSTIGKSAVALSRSKKIRHLSIGDLKRSIEKGEVKSAYAEMLKKKEHPDRKTGAAPSEAMIGIMEEFILAKLQSLTILDGFPRYMDRVAPFQKSMCQIGADVLALCVVEVEDEIALERLEEREVREHQKVKDPYERLMDHKLNVVPTLRRLAEDYPLFLLDGARPAEDNAERLLEIYHDTRPQL